MVCLGQRRIIVRFTGRTHQYEGYARPSTPKWPNCLLNRAMADESSMPTQPPPEYWYTKAPSSYSATVQLYTLSGQLDHMLVRYRRRMENTPYCDFCESQDLRAEAGLKLSISVSKILHAAELEDTPELGSSLKSWFYSDTFWPLQMNAYYLGRSPPLKGILPPAWDKITGKKIAEIIHSKSILLAGQIWGVGYEGEDEEMERGGLTHFAPRSDGSQDLDSVV
ncbi:hypothetical protein PIIN_06035 [Serendipita indica DSM 11827]|uniref:Uncharacterized protein n=1 Tax=Serendipita indica (strain DSM 11827) TaxID=1109443 RepID=G4TLA2_SERID|nr:hypothetical protein PIIN_06035 [Serendipita indica DSM 11827]